MKVRLARVAMARSGDKGAASNVGLFARTPELYPVIEREVTAARVRAHFAGIAHGEVVRYTAPNLRALNFILNDSLGGCGSESLKTDAQGKTHGEALLFMEIEVPDALVPPPPGARR